MVAARTQTVLGSVSTGVIMASRVPPERLLKIPKGFSGRAYRASEKPGGIRIRVIPGGKSYYLSKIIVRTVLTRYYRMHFKTNRFPHSLLQSNVTRRRNQHFMHLKQHLDLFPITQQLILKDICIFIQCRMRGEVW
jgi:hypothetical protein